MAAKKTYTNQTGQVLRFSEDGKDHTVAPGGSFTVAPTSYTEGLVARGMASSKDAKEAPAPEQAAGPETPAANEKTANATPAPKAK